MDISKSERAKNPLLRAIDAGRAEGRIEGRIEGLRGLLLSRLQREGARVNPELRRRVESCTDEATLIRWIERLMSGASLDEALSA